MSAKQHRDSLSPPSTTSTPTTGTATPILEPEWDIRPNAYDAKIIERIPHVPGTPLCYCIGVPGHREPAGYPGQACRQKPASKRLPQVGRIYLPPQPRVFHWCTRMEIFELYHRLGWTKLPEGQAFNLEAHLYKQFVEAKEEADQTSPSARAIFKAVRTWGVAELLGYNQRLAGKLRREMLEKMGRLRALKELEEKDRYETARIIWEHTPHSSAGLDLEMLRFSYKVNMGMQQAAFERQLWELKHGPICLPGLGC